MTTKRKNILGRHAKPTARHGILGGLVAGVAAGLLIPDVGALADDGTAHQTLLMRPIELGTSGGNVNDITAFCCSGTLGALVEDADGSYILSNNHVLARANLAAPGEGISQPGLIDNLCSVAPENPVATLTDFVVLNFDGGSNTVDAAIAQIVPGAVDPSGDILDIGSPTSLVTQAVIGMPVRKSGRTTGLTSGIVSIVDYDVVVTYSKECNKGRQRANFVGQIFVSNNGSDFSAGGDSGSLILDGSANPVGLLFAGSDAGTIANPIQEVLDCLGVGMAGGATVGNSANCSHQEPTAGSGDDGGSGGGGRPPWAGGPGGSNSNGPFGLEIAGAVKAANRDRLFAIRGVVGVGLSVDEAGDPVIVVTLENAARDADNPIPDEIDGIPVHTMVTGAFTAY